MQLEDDSESHLLLSIRLSSPVQGQINPPPGHLSVATSATLQLPTSLLLGDLFSLMASVCS